jgi:hypothetical protein
MTGHDWSEVVGTIGVFALVISVVTVGIWQLAATWRARAVLAREREYRTIADRSALVQESTERQLAEIGGRLAEMQTRLQSVERVLKDVE